MSNKEYLHLASRIVTYTQDVQKSVLLEGEYKESAAYGSVIALETLTNCYFSGHINKSMTHEEAENAIEQFEIVSQNQSSGDGCKAVLDMVAGRIAVMMKEHDKSSQPWHKNAKDAEERF